MKWFIVSLRKYAVFSGRAHRQEFWWATLVYVLIACCLLLVDRAIVAERGEVELGLGPFTSTFLLASWLPSTSLAVRRLHDCGHPGWLWLVTLIPFIGPVVLLVLCAQPGDFDSNRFGPAPEEPPRDVQETVSGDEP